MPVVKEEFTFPSTVGDLDIHAISWKPEDGNVQAVFQFVHGMAEYIDRYDSFARYLAERGYAVYGNDHIGHGSSVNKKYPLGYFGTDNENGKIFVEDTKKMTDIIKKENPGKKVIMFGHSMGSFVARAYCAKYGNDIDGAIICGTAGPNPAIGVALAISGARTKVAAKKEGKLINSLAFGAYNNKTDKRTGFDWLSFNEKNVDKYIADPLCGFPFSNQGFHDLLTLNKYMCSDEVFNGIPKDLPMLFVAGKDDPVGSYTKGVEQTLESLEKTGHTNVSHKYYESRHEIHNEEHPEGFYDDLIAWAKKL